MSESVLSPPPRKRKMISLGSLAGLGLIVAVGYGIVLHIDRSGAERALASERSQQIPDIRTMIARVSTSAIPLDLPGETAGLETSAINARASGYIAKRFVDTVNFHPGRHLFEQRHHAVRHIGIQLIVAAKADYPVAPEQLFLLEKWCPHDNAHGFRFRRSRNHASVVV